jgi:CheY-like chemotaxis protein
MSDHSDPKTKSVLIVDDDESVLNLLEILVKRDGFQIDLARTGDEALEKLKRHQDALILDLMLPGTTSGFVVLKKLREWGKPVPPVIVVTAYVSHKEVAEVQKDPNVALFLSKPIHQEKLLEALHRVMHTKAPEHKPYVAPKHPDDKKKA